MSKVGKDVIYKRGDTHRPYKRTGKTSKRNRWVLVKRLDFDELPKAERILRKAGIEYRIRERSYPGSSYNNPGFILKSVFARKKDENKILGLLSQF